MTIIIKIEPKKRSKKVVITTEFDDKKDEFTCDDFVESLRSDLILGLQARDVAHALFDFDQDLRKIIKYHDPDMPNAEYSRDMIDAFDICREKLREALDSHNVSENFL